MFDIPEQENIKEEIKKAYIELGKVDAQRQAAIARLDFLESICKHPEKIAVSHCGELAQRCTTCGKEW